MPLRIRTEEFWDGVSWGIKWLIVLMHLGFAIPSFFRFNIPIIYPSWQAFDDHVPFWWWGVASVVAAGLLIALPSKFPSGVISTSVSAFVLYLIGLTFWNSAGLISGALIYTAFGAVMGALMFRAAWMWAIRIAWFRRWMLTHGRQ